MIIKLELYLMLGDGIDQRVACTCVLYEEAANTGSKGTKVTRRQQNEKHQRPRQNRMREVMLYSTYKC